MSTYQITGYPLIKFISKKYVEGFQSGSLRFGSLKYYREQEEKNADHTVGDSYEATIVPEKSFLRLGGDLEVKINSIRNVYSYDYVLCLFQPNHVNYNGFTEEQKKKLPSFGDMAIIITDSDAFIQRIKSEASKTGRSIDHKQVRYYEDEPISRRVEGLNKGPDIAFWKRKSQYAYQQEYRILLHENSQSSSHVNLKIGDIRDITLAIPTRELLKYRFTTNEI